MGCFMRADFLSAIKQLLPGGTAWDITNNTHLRKLFEAIAVLPEQLRTEIENVYMEYFPDSTNNIDKWEQVFSVVFPKAELEQRRNTLFLLWSRNYGGQSKYFLQLVLQEIFPEIIVEENIPCANPRQSNIAYLCDCDNSVMVCGNRKALCDYREGDDDLKPTILRNDTSGLYSIPNDKKYWAFCFYVCKKVVRNERGEILYIEKLEIPIMYKNYIEYFILRIKPVHTIAVMAIKWIEE